MLNKFIAPTKEELNKYYSLGYTMKEIADYLNISSGTVCNYFKKYGIKSRPAMTDLTKAKISKANKGKKNRLGYKASEETLQKMRDANLKKGIGHKKKRKDGYIAVYFPDHPKSNKDGYIMEHDLVMECYIGRWIQNDEVVHHINKNRSDNRIENLKLMTKSEHSRFHIMELYKKGSEQNAQ